MVAVGRLYPVPQATSHLAHGRPHVADYAWLLLILLMTINEAFAALPRPFPTVSTVPKFFYNGTFASQTCVEKFNCSTVGANLPECSCHPKCALFDECCEDKRPTNWRQLKLPPDAYECTPMLLADAYNDSASKLTKLDYFYVITKCPPNFDIPLIQGLCQEPWNFFVNGTAPLVTDNSTGLTYANQFCAYCNGVKLSVGVSWPVQNVCLEVPALGLTGCKQRWIKPTNLTADLADCKGPYIRSCPLSAPPSMQAACTDNPVKRFYDYINTTVYRNYNCSLCYSFINSNVCNQWQVSFNGAPDAGLQALLGLYNCPKRLATFATAEERAFWIAACPEITFDTGNCSEALSMTALSSMYKSNPTDEYYITSEGVWVRYNSTYATCARCELSNHTVAANGSGYANSTLGNITVDGATYWLPFFKVMDSGYVAVCSPEPMDLPAEKCTDLPGVVSQVLMALSLLGLALYAVAYGLLQSLRNLPGQIVLHQSVAFFFGFLLFMLRVPAGSASDGACTALGLLSHFFFLAAFNWSSVYAIEVVRALGFQAYGSGFTKRRIRYAIVGWLVPALVIAAAIATNWATSNNVFRPAYGRPQCFINSEYGQRIFFTAPLAFFLLIDVVIYVYIIIKLVIISGQTKMVREAHHEKLFLAVKLVFALGITWIFAVLASATGECTLVYIFELLNSLQGVFIFLIFVCNAKTSGQIHKKVRVQKSFISGAGAGTTLSTRDSSSSGSTILPKRKSVLGVNSFSPVSLAMDAHENESKPPR